MRVVFDHSDAVAPNITTFWFRPEARVRFEPGQFAEFRVPHAVMDSRGDTREFSISSLPGEPLVALTTNFAPKNGSSYKRALQNLKLGDEIYMAEPMGDFVLPKDSTIPLVFVAAGIGSVPYATMVRWLAHRGERRPIKLIYSVSRQEHFMYDDVWQSYGVDVIPVLTQKIGRLTPQKIMKLIQPLAIQLIYFAGPQTMIEPLFDDLLSLGIPRGQLLLDYFSGY